ncbi:hypothetical protein BH23ACT5_BH23ACT5_15830 [soil metagenome]
MPVVDILAAEFSDEVTFVAPAWKAGLEATAARAAELMPSGLIHWGLDADEVIFAAYGIPYQPATVLISAEGAIVETWAGARSEEVIRSSIEALIGG